MVQFARRRKLNALAITDHDTISGIAEAQQAAADSPVIIPAVELSSQLDGNEIHVLGYFLQLDCPILQTELPRLQGERVHRARLMVDKLAALGAPVQWERVLGLARGGAITRHHIARALAETGQVGSVDEAFERYLRVGHPAYVHHEMLTPAQAIHLIHESGGAAVLAHPAVIADYTGLIERLIPQGLDGVEVIHPRNGSIVRQNLRALISRHDLVMSGGSDFHQQGDLFAAELIPPTCLRDLRERAQKWR